MKYKYCPKCKDEYQDWVIKCAECGIALVAELPAEPELPKEGSSGEVPTNEKFVTVYESVIMQPVDVIKSVLEGEGILCMVRGHDSMRPYLSFISGIDLQVPEKDRLKAEKIIGELDI